MNPIPRYYTSTVRPLGNTISVAKEGSSTCFILGLRADRLRPVIDRLEPSLSISVEEVDPDLIMSDSRWLSLAGSALPRHELLRSKDFGCVRLSGTDVRSFLEAKFSLITEAKSNDLAAVFVDWE